jgi:phosphatidate phosphatase LPIN
MKLGEGGEAFFVFETSSPVPEGLQTSPVVSPVASPSALPAEGSPLPELEPLDLAGDIQRPGTARSATATGTVTKTLLEALDRPGSGERNFCRVSRCIADTRRICIFIIKSYKYGWRRKLD